jgi:hypothetical protein
LTINDNNMSVNTVKNGYIEIARPAGKYVIEVHY